MIKEKHGQYASWAVWAAAGDTATSNIGDIGVLDPARNPTLLAALNPKVVMLGLNISRPVLEPLSNFHDKKAQAKDFKIRHAFTGTRFYGAYMTDVLKFFVEVESSKVMSTVRKRPDILQDSAAILREEFRDLGVSQPELIAFGGYAASLAKKVLSPTDYSSLVRVTHYSHFVGQDNYRSEVLSQCS
ncbi:hypothetical protein [Adhaeretor mobilis]|nr:hypothetical protein [Adhaeretor mobilis]